VDIGCGTLLAAGRGAAYIPLVLSGAGCAAIFWGTSRSESNCSGDVVGDRTAKGGLVAVWWKVHAMPIGTLGKVH
jgi:hypothetical protein